MGRSDAPRTRVNGHRVPCLFLADGVYHRHAIFPWEEWFGFYAVFGFVACVMLVLGAKHLLRPIVMRDEEYYDR